MLETSLDAPRLFDLSGRVALVTGAGSGIGQRIALGLAQCGADVACLDRRDDGGTAETVEAIRAAGRKALAIAADVTQRPPSTRRWRGRSTSSAPSPSPSTPPASPTPTRPRR